jgi:hypothetical protein
MSDFETHPVGTAARIAALEAVVAAGDGLAALVEQEHSPNIDHHHPLEVSEGDWERIRAALTTYRVAKGAKP